MVIGLTPMLVVGALSILTTARAGAAPTLVGLSSSYDNGGPRFVQYARDLGADVTRLQDRHPSASAASVKAEVDLARSIPAVPVVPANWYPRPDDEWPPPTDAEVRNLGEWAKAMDQGWIEFGNEISYGYRGFGCDYATEYARQAKIAADAIRAANPRVGLIVDVDVSHCWPEPDWISRMQASVPNLDDHLAGYVMHPYGPESRYAPRLDRVKNELLEEGWAFGPDKPFFITEDGISSHDGRCLDDNYGWPLCMTFAEAGPALRAKVPDVLARWPVRVYAIYQLFDQRFFADPSDNREHWFGVFTLDGVPKGDYTNAVRDVMDGNPG